MVVKTENSTRTKVREAAFQAQIIALARRCGWLVHHSRPSVNKRGQWSTAIAGDAGLPDLVMAKGGRVFLLELKGDGGSLQANQKAWAEAITGVPARRGEVYLRGENLAYAIVYPDDFDEVSRWLMRPWPVIRALA